jgi:hypothetical protein
VTSPPKKAGAVLLVGGEPCFLRAVSVLRVASTPPVTAVPGGPPELLGIALHEGAVLPVLAIGSARREMVVCQCAGELIGLVGGEVARTGLFDVSPGQPDAVDYEGRTARPLDLTALHDILQAARRAGPFAVGRGGLGR